MNAEVATLYARIPKIDCQQKCHAFCGPIVQLGGYTEAEREQVESALRGAAIVRPEGASDLVCEALDAAGRCAIYAARPAICRLWGVSEDMPCPHGCKAERILSKAESNEILNALSAIAGPGRFVGLLKPANND